ncbi:MULTISPECIES: response regulator transcription factor [unclassified Arthrobacter]|uniref:response regulator transcription factor n=1 Tax=unclassified Arthrobacter TaxID=235627 RepID=UPI001E3726C2|nr:MULTISPECIES: response regulator transcription factor [unclassified Arthrobacter]MCC9145932.1 response regulator transcription factor [Arthrobacter sp. zg-Y919]MDK1277161.1 response regulator transcription factor [Arthrobacter sp. zg.Y919]WIB03678.1 response regulator transcription factor [Arthrobacter sp. zg-Y919]
MTITVAIADDQAIVRAGLRVILETSPDIEVVGEASDGHEAVALVRAKRPDVVCMDIRMPGLDGISATRTITADPQNTTGVLMLTTFELDDYVFGALEAGASGFLLKGADEDSLLDAVRSVARGDGTLDQRLTRRVLIEFANRTAGPRRPPTSLAVPLTTRETEILTLLCEGLSTSEIGERLFVESTTVKYHVAGILTKTGARDRLQAAVWAFRNGVVSVPR